jgi:hypothetical protein
LTTSVQNATLPASNQGDYSKAVAALLPIIDVIRQFAAPGSTDDDFDPADVSESAGRARESSRARRMVFSFDDDENTRGMRESSVPRGMTFTFET